MQKFLLLAFITLLFTGTQVQTITTVIGGNGSGTAANQLSYPTGIFVDAAGYIYVADNGSNQRLQKYPPNSTPDTGGITLVGGSGVNLAGELDGLLLDSSGNIYLSLNSGNNISEIQKYPPNSRPGTLGTTIAGGHFGNSASQLNNAMGLCLAHGGDLYVCDYSNNRIQDFPAGSTAGTNATTVANVTDNIGEPQSICFDHNGNMFVGHFGGVEEFIANTSIHKNVSGSSASPLTNCSAIYVDPNDNLFVLDRGNNRVLRFPPGSDSITPGVVVAGGNGRGSAANQLDNPTSMFITATGDIYIVDAGNYRVQKWSKAATGLFDLNTDNSFILYPNPNRGSFTLQSHKSIGKEYNIYDIAGRKISTGLITTDKQTVSLKNIPTGSYTVQIDGNNAKQFVVKE